MPKFIQNYLFEIVAVLALMFGVLSARAFYNQQFVGVEEIVGTCNLQKEPCVINIPNLAGKITLEINPRPIPVLKEFVVNIKTDNFQPKNMVVDLAGVNMNMGINRQPAKLLNQNNEYQATMLIPICTTELMNWDMAILLETENNRKLKVLTKFETLERL